MSTRTEVKKAIKKRERYFNNYMVILKTLFHNSVVVKNVEEVELPKRYLLRVLLEKGGIAYDKQTGLYLPFVKQGIDIYGLPTAYSLIGYNGYNVHRLPQEVIILRANDLNEAPNLRA